MMRTHTTPILVAALLGQVGIGSKAQALADLPDAVASEVKDLARLPRGTYTLVRQWGVETAGHNTGRLMDDPEAEGAKAWEAAPGVDEPNTMLYGPYIEVEPGSYVAFFRMKLVEPPDDDLVGSLDACVSYAQDILSVWDVSGEDLTVGKYVQVPLGFVYERGKLECRFTWHGNAPLRIDRVSLFRLSGADVSGGLWRVPEPVPSGEPKDLAYYTEPRPFPDIFPRSAPPAKTLLVCDLRKQRSDVRMMVYSLQGLVNRPQPRLYCLSAATDPQWLQHMQDRGWVESTETIADPMSLLDRFRDAYEGIIITDPGLPASKNVATMIASARNGLVVSPRLAAQLSLPVLDDLRGRWQKSVEAYRWAFDTLWPNLNHHVIACSWPDHLALRDYLVANKVFIFWLSGSLDGARKYASPDDEVRLMEELLAKMPVNIPVMSYPWAGKDIGIGEGPGVSLFAEFGKYLVGTIDTGNLTVHSGIRVDRLRQKPAPPTPELQAHKVYFSYIISDGDNLPVLTNGNFPQLWQDKVRGRFPVGWTLSPSASMLIPDLVDYYYSTATEADYFLGAVSGVGYTYPDLYGRRYRDPDRQRVYDEFLAQTGEYMRRVDETQCWVMNATRPDVIARYAERIPFLDALFPDYGRRLPPGQEPTYPTARNMPVFHAVGVWRQNATREERIEELVADIRRMTPPHRPAFLHVFVLNWFADLPMLQEALRELGPEYAAVRPDHLAQLWRQQMASEKILLRAPFVAAGVEGTDLALQGSVRNMTDDPQDVALNVGAGLEGASLDPRRVALKPAQEASLNLIGKPAGETITLEARGAFGTRTAEVRVRRIQRAEVFGEWPAGRPLVPVTYLEAEGLAHRSGRQEANPQASDGNEWVARKGEDEPLHVVFGPYTPLPAGRYLALFRMRRLDEGTGLLATVDTCVAGGTPQTGLRLLHAEELPLDEYRWVPVEFEHPGDNFETRVQWSGAASMAVDAVAVWRTD